MEYDVQIVNDGDLPDGHDMVIVERDGGRPAVMLICGRPAKMWTTMRDWEASHGPRGVSTLPRAV